MKPAQGGTPVEFEQQLVQDKLRDETLRELLRELQEIRKKPAWAVLGLPADADAAAARAAFLALCKRSHPHAYAHFDSLEISSAATELFIAQKRAWATLNAARQPPNTQSPEPSPIVRQQPDRRAETRNLWQQRSVPPQQVSIAPTKASPVAGAQPAMSLRPARSEEQRRAADAQLAVAQALKLVAASRFDAALEQLAAVHRRWPEHRDAELWLLVCKARKLKSTGMCADATKAYRAVLALDPQHQEAQKHLDEASALGRPSYRTGKWFGSPGD